MVVCLLYFLLMSSLASIASLMSGFTWEVNTFFAVFIVLMILGDLTEGTMFQHFFGAAKALFVVFFWILSLKNGIVNVALENLTLTVDLTMIYAFATLLSLLGLVRVMLQLINFMNERAETAVQSSR